MHFRDKVIWITGASSGIGAELTKQLESLDAKLIITARNEDVLRKMKDKFSTSTECHVLVADFLRDDLEELTRQAIGIYNRIDIFINCAGVSQRSLAADTNMEVYRQLMELNYFAPIRITKILLAQIQAQGGGQIVVLNSLAGLMGFPMRTGYSAAKHALKGFFETLQVEHTIKGLNISIVSPGRINTPISQSALTGDGSAHEKMDEGQLNGIAVEVCAKKILKAVAQKKKHILIARKERVLWWCWKYFRFLYYSIARKTGMKN